MFFRIRTPQLLQANQACHATTQTISSLPESTLDKRVSKPAMAANAFFIVLPRQGIRRTHVDPKDEEKKEWNPLGKHEIEQHNLGCDGDGGVSMAEPRGCSDDGDGGGGSEGGAGGGGRWRDRDDVVKVAAVVAWCSVGDDSGCEMKVLVVAGKWPDSGDGAGIIKTGRSVVCVG
ncbi:hypothetical protein Tco_0319513 [Tanacetum coccineum]